MVTLVWLILVWLSLFGYIRSDELLVTKLENNNFFGPFRDLNPEQSSVFSNKKAVAW